MASLIPSFSCCCCSFPFPSSPSLLLLPSLPLSSSSFFSPSLSLPFPHLQLLLLHSFLTFVPVLPPWLNASPVFSACWKWTQPLGSSPSLLYPEGFLEYSSPPWLPSDSPSCLVKPLLDPFLFLCLCPDPPKWLSVPGAMPLSPAGCI